MSVRPTVIRVSYDEKAKPENNKPKPKVTLDDLAKEYVTPENLYGEVTAIDYDFKFLGIDEKTKKLRFALIFWMETDDGHLVEKRAIEFSCNVTDLPVCTADNDPQECKVIFPVV